MILTMKQFSITLIFLIHINAAQSQVSDSIKYQSLEPYDFHLQYLREDSALLIDVREFFEFKGKRIKEAINIPSSGNLDFAADTIDENYALFLYCTTDYRSKRAAEEFYDKGFRKLYSLEGGIAAWKKDRFPMERKKIKRKK